MFSVEPHMGSNQSPVEFTVLAGHLFSRLIDTIQVRTRDVFFSGKGLGQRDKDRLKRLFSQFNRDPEPTELFSLDFAARSWDREHGIPAIALALESEGKPIKHDHIAEASLSDMLKLVHIHASHRVFLGRVNAGSYKSHGLYMPKWDTVKEEIEQVFAFAARNRLVPDDGSLTALILHTSNARQDWRYTIQTSTGAQMRCSDWARPECVSHPAPEDSK
ncbi:MAG: hypothetical protein ACKVZJ_13670 [Phycisphaerales bacterium]